MTDRRVHLDILDVKDPCEESWAAMRGDDVSRFCGMCHQNVYNLSEMDRADAERFVAEAEGRVCVRFYRRADGTVVTSDCAPVRFRAARRAASKGLAFAGMGIAGLFGLVGALGFTSMHVAGSWVEEVARKVTSEVDPEPDIEVMGEMPMHWEGDDIETDEPATTEPATTEPAVDGEGSGA
ncbi:MAG: hypothetical protein H6719_36385 [Sandaracinaceae bacterium]|nr:hypothetical protein [Sandaracinaceae bacterium]